MNTLDELAANGKRAVGDDCLSECYGRFFATLSREWFPAKTDTRLIFSATLDDSAFAHVNVLF